MYAAVLFTLMLSIRSFLFSNAFAEPFALFGYSNVTMAGYSSPLPFNIYYSFSRSPTPLFNLPIFYSYQLGIGPVVEEKLAALSLFGITFAAAILVGRLAYATFGGSSRLRCLVFSNLFAALCMINTISTYDFGGELYVFALCTPLLVYVLLKSFRWVAGVDSSWRDIAKVSIVTSFMTLGDPRYFLWVELALIALVAASFAAADERRRSLRLFGGVTLGLVPTVALTYFLEVFGSGSGLYVSPRNLSYAEISQFSGVTKPVQIFQLLGTPWPGPVLGPPSLAFIPPIAINRLVTSGSPPIVLLTAGWDQSLWLVALFFLPLLAFACLLLMGRQNRLILLFPGALLFLAFSMGAAFPIRGFVNSYLALGRAPLVGGVWAITFAIPNFFNQVTVAYLLLFAAWVVRRVIDGVSLSEQPSGLRRSLAAVLSRVRRTPARFPDRSRSFTGLSGKRAAHSRTLPVILAVILVTIVLAPDWQYFDGSFFPGNYVPGQPGNGVATSGDYAPVEPPGFWLKAFDALAAGDNGSYAIAMTPVVNFTYRWTGTLSAVVDPGIAPDARFYTFLDEAMKNGTAYEIRPLMDVFGVRYFLVDNTSVTPTTRYFDFLSSCDCLDIVASYSSPPELWVFEDPNSTLYPGAQQSVIGLAGTDSVLETETAISRTIGHSPILVPLKDGTVAVESDPTAVAQTDISLFEYPDLSVTVGLPPPALRLLPVFYPVASTDVAIGGGWVATAASTGMVMSAANGTVSLTTSDGVSPSSGIVAIDYGSILVPGRTAVDVPNFNATGVSVNWSFEYRLEGTASSIETGVFCNDFRLANGFSYSTEIIPSGGWRFESTRAYIPPGARTFTVQISADANGTIQIRNLTARYSLESVRHATPYAVAGESARAKVNGSYLISAATSNLTQTFHPVSTTDVPIGAGWVATAASTGMNLSEVNGTVNLTTSNGSALRGGILAVDYGSILLPGKSAILVPNYNETDVLVNWTFQYRIVGSASSLETGVFSNDYRLANNFSETERLPFYSNWTSVSESVLVPKGARTFTVQLDGNFNGTLQVRGLSGRYTYESVSSYSENPKIQTYVGSGPYVIYSEVDGNGSICLNLVCTVSNGSAPRVAALSFSSSGSGNLSLDFGSLGVFAVLVIPAGLVQLLRAPSASTAFKSFTQLSDSFSLRYTTSGFTTTPAYPWVLTNAAMVCDSLFGLPALRVAGNTTVTASIPGGFGANVLVVTYVLGYVASLLMLFLPTSIAWLYTRVIRIIPGRRARP